METPTEVYFPYHQDYETTEAEFKYLQSNPAPHRDQGNKGRGDGGMAPAGALQRGGEENWKERDRANLCG